MGALVYSNCNVPMRSANVKVPKNPIPLVKTASKLSEGIEFLSLLPFRVYDDQKCRRFNQSKGLGGA